MTLNELIRKTNEITNQLSSGEIPIMHGDQEVWFDFKLVAPRLITDPVAYQNSKLSGGRKMKVKELIAELQKLDQEKNIWNVYDTLMVYPPEIEIAHPDDIGYKGIEEGDYVMYHG